MDFFLRLHASLGNVGMMAWNRLFRFIDPSYSGPYAKTLE